MYVNSLIVTALLFAFYNLPNVYASSGKQNAAFISSPTGQQVELKDIESALYGKKNGGRKAASFRNYDLYEVTKKSVQTDGKTIPLTKGIWTGMSKDRHVTSEYRNDHVKVVYERSNITQPIALIVDEHRMKAVNTKKYPGIFVSSSTGTTSRRSGNNKSYSTSRTNTKHESNKVQVDVKEQVKKVKDKLLTKSAQYMPANYPSCQNTRAIREIELAVFFDSTFCSAAGSTSAAMTQVKTYIDMINTSLQRILCLRVKLVYLSNECATTSSMFGSSFSTSDKDDYLPQLNSYYINSRMRYLSADYVLFYSRSSGNFNDWHYYTRPCSTTYRTGWVNTQPSDDAAYFLSNSLEIILNIVSTNRDSNILHRKFSSGNILTTVHRDVAKDVISTIDSRRDTCIDVPTSINVPRIPNPRPSSQMLFADDGLSGYGFVNCTGYNGLQYTRISSDDEWIRASVLQHTGYFHAKVQLRRKYIYDSDGDYTGNKYVYVVTSYRRAMSMKMDLSYSDLAPNRFPVSLAETIISKWKASEIEKDIYTLSGEPFCDKQVFITFYLRIAKIYVPRVGSSKVESLHGIYFNFEWTPLCSACRSGNYIRAALGRICPTCM